MKNTDFLKSSLVSTRLFWIIKLKQAEKLEDNHHPVGRRTPCELIANCWAPFTAKRVKALLIGSCILERTNGIQICYPTSKSIAKLSRLRDSRFLRVQSWREQCRHIQHSSIRENVSRLRNISSEPPCTRAALFKFSNCLSSMVPWWCSFQLFWYGVGRPVITSEVGNWSVFVLIGCVLYSGLS